VELERCPEAGVAAADDGHVDGDLVLERGRLRRLELRGERLVEPPGRKRGRRDHGRKR
jgi:hypothetical protein